MIHCRRYVIGAKSSLFWALLFFAGVQLTCSAIMDLWRQELHDPEFGRRLGILRSRMAERPERPLLLLVGSSRTVLSFRPEILPPMRTPSGEQPLVFNFSHIGAGPVFNMMDVRRLLKEGIRPRWLVVEVMRPHLFHEARVWVTTYVGLRDLGPLQRYFSPWSLYGRYLLERLVTKHSLQTEMARRVAPGWVAGDANVFPIDRLGGSPSLDVYLDPREMQRRSQHALQQYAWVGAASEIFPNSDRAIRELVSLCRRHDIQLILLRTPEGKAFKQLYSPTGRSKIEEYCERLQREEDVPVIDAGDWLDESDFFDGHHVLLNGAESFTRRLAREVLEPMIGEGQEPRTK